MRVAVVGSGHFLGSGHPDINSSRGLGHADHDLLDSVGGHPSVT